MIETSSTREVRDAIRQGPEAGHETAHPRSGRAALQARRHRRRRRGGRDVRRRPDQRRLLRATSPPRRISSRTSSPTSCAPNAKASTPSPQIGRDSRRSSAPTSLPQHRDQCADGCPSAALLDEIARRPAATRQVFTDELMARDRRHRLAPGPDRRRGRSNRRAHGLRTDGRHPAARQGTDRPRPLRSAPRPGRGDGLEAAGRLRSLAART